MAPNSYGNEGLLDLLERWLNETPTQAEVEAERKSLALIMAALSQPHGPNESRLLLSKWEAASESFDTRTEKGAFALARVVNDLGDETREYLKRTHATNDRQEKT